MTVVTTVSGQGTVLVYPGGKDFAVGVRDEVLPIDTRHSGIMPPGPTNTLPPFVGAASGVGFSFGMTGVLAVIWLGYT